MHFYLTITHLEQVSNSLLLSNKDKKMGGGGKKSELVNYPTEQHQWTVMLVIFFL
jgi:hypothetical protein